MTDTPSTEKLEADGSIGFLSQMLTLAAMSVSISSRRRNLQSMLLAKRKLEKKLRKTLSSRSESDEAEANQA